YLLARPRTLLVLVLFVTMAAATVFFLLTSLALMASESAVVKVIVAAVNLLLMTLVGEIVSKVLAARYRVEVCRLTAPWVLYAFRAVQPFLLLVENGLVSPLVRVITPERKPERLTEEELDALLHQGSAEGAIDADERRVLGQVIRLSGLRVKDVMTHRVDMHWVEDTATHAEVAAFVRENRMTRLPVVTAGEDIDQGVLGLLDVKRYLAMYAERAMGLPRLPALSPLSVTDAMDPVRYVPASASLDKLLDQFSSAGIKLGLVVDEHGGVVGIVSTENVVQRLIAELTSDEDLELESQVKQLPAPDGRWSVPGRLTVRDWATMFGLVGGSVEARVSTVGGLIFAKLGRVPRVGDVVMVGNLLLEVLSLVPGEHGSMGRVVASAAVSIVENSAGHDGSAGGGGA
ncbi:MAG: CNNM domain-containing protein, partial [Phycisphaerales bacterium]|nr:CNNM domain-containing protein [Phycisphaerales bacterium]